MKKKLGRFWLFLLIICQTVFFVACGPVDAVVSFFADDGTGYIFKIALDADPKCLDPQLAEDENSIVIAKNLFAGLMDYDENGRLVLKLAEDYSISSDELKYTFRLKEDCGWYAAGEYSHPVTANDFVFGFRRLMNPQTDSPHSEKYFCIAGAEEARRGDIPVEDIGVSAPDDYTVEFTLAFPNADFLALLAELPAMPCCEDFFTASGGKYGLEADATCSNGPFYLRYWLYDPYGKNNYVRLRKNPNYGENDKVSPAGINYLITKDKDVREADFREGSTNVIVFQAGSIPDTDESFIAGYSHTAGIIFNEKIKAFSNPEIRNLFSLAIDRESLSKDAPDILKPALTLIPTEGAIAARGYVSRIPKEAVEENASMAEYKWSFMLTDQEKSELIGMTIMVPEDFGYGYLLEKLTDSWYSAFNIHFAVEMVNSHDYAERIKSGDYDIAFADIGSDEPSPLGFIRSFGSDKTFGFSPDEAVEALRGEGKYSSSTSLNYACSEAENAIIGEHRFIPLWYLPTVCAYDSDIEGLRFESYGGTVYFENAKKF